MTSQGVIALGCITWTQGLITLSPLTDDDSDKASWQQMIDDERNGKRRKTQGKSD